jgi:hypothetical protein
MGQAAHARVGGHYLRDLHLFRYDKLLDRLIASG